MHNYQFLIDICQYRLDLGNVATRFTWTGMRRGINGTKHMGTMTRHHCAALSDCADAREILIYELASSRVRDNQYEYITIVSVFVVCIGIALAAITMFQPVDIDLMAPLYWN